MSTPGRVIKKVGYFVLVMVLLAISYNLIKSLLGYLKLDDRFISAEKDVEKLSNEKSDLEFTLYDEDAEYVVEKDLRDSLGFSRSGEVVVVLPEELVTRTVEERKHQEEQKEVLPNWKNWMNLFF